MQIGCLIWVVLIIVLFGGLETLGFIIGAIIAGCIAFWFYLSYRDDVKKKGRKGK